MTTDDSITVTITMAKSMLRMRPLDMREQLAEDDALSTMLGRQVLAKARADLMAAWEAPGERRG